jgi:hypothetical protein
MGWRMKGCALICSAVFHRGERRDEKVRRRRGEDYGNL